MHVFIHLRSSNSQPIGTGVVFSIGENSGNFRKFPPDVKFLENLQLQIC